MKRTLRCTFREYDGEITGKKGYRVVLLQEGLGNFGNAFYYTKQALASAAPLFEGAQIFADHPSTIEEESRPERSVKDLVGHYEDVKVEESDGVSMLCGTVRIPDGAPFDWVRSLMNHAIMFSKKYNESDKDFIGLSINASGDADATAIDSMITAVPESLRPKLRQALDMGITQANVTNSISEAVSCDLVTRAGAKGRVLNLVEQNKENSMFGKKPMDGEKKPEADAKPEMPAKPAANPEHPDEQKDLELIKAQVAKYLGKDGEGKESECKQVAQAYTEMGHKQEEAYEMAAKHMKAASILAGKKEAEEKAKCEADEAAKKEADEKAKIEAEEKGDKKESAVALAGRVAFLEAELAKRDLEKHMENELGKSKLSRSMTKLFKETVGEIKTKKEFDHAFKIFKAAIPTGGEAFVMESGEKMPMNESESNNAVSFSDCVDK